MNNSSNFNDYPKILKIEEDGKIIALDKNGQINTDLNIHTIDDEKQRLIFAKIIYNPYSRSNKKYDDVNILKYLSTVIFTLFKYIFAITVSIITTYHIIMVFIGINNEFLNEPIVIMFLAFVVFCVLTQLILWAVS